MDGRPATPIVCSLLINQASGGEARFQFHPPFRFDAAVSQLVVEVDHADIAVVKIDIEPSRHANGVLSRCPRTLILHRGFQAREDAFGAGINAACELPDCGGVLLVGQRDAEQFRHLIELLLENVCHFKTFLVAGKVVGRTGRASSERATVEVDCGKCRSSRGNWIRRRALNSRLWTPAALIRLDIEPKPIAAIQIVDAGFAQLGGVDENITVIAASGDEPVLFGGAVT